MNRQIRIGDIYMVEFQGDGNVQRGMRPGIVVQNNMGNKYSPNVIVLPLTTSIKKLSQPTHVFIPADGTGLVRDSMCLAENPESVPKASLSRYISTLNDSLMAEIAEAFMLATSLITFIDIDKVLELKAKATKMNIA